MTFVQQLKQLFSCVRNNCGEKKNKQKPNKKQMLAGLDQCLGAHTGFSQRPLAEGLTLCVLHCDAVLSLLDGAFLRVIDFSIMEERQAAGTE